MEIQSLSPEWTMVSWAKCTTRVGQKPYHLGHFVRPAVEKSEKDSPVGALVGQTLKETL